MIKNKVIDIKKYFKNIENKLKNILEFKHTLFYKILKNNF